MKEYVFGKPPPTVREMKRENRRAARRAERDIGRQMADVEKREAELLNQVKAFCRKGDSKMAKATSLDLVRVRKTKQRVAGARSAQMSLQATLGNTINGAVVTESMQGGLEAMKRVSSGAGMDPARIRKMGASFATEMDKLELVDEVVEDMMTTSAGVGGGEDNDDDEDSEATLILNEVLHSQAVAAPALPLAPPLTSSQAPEQPHHHDNNSVPQSIPVSCQQHEEVAAAQTSHVDLEERLRRLTMDNEPRAEEK